MRSRPWSRPEVIAELRDRLWLHVSPAATAHDTVLQAAALLQLPPGDVARLGRLQFVLDPAVKALLSLAIKACLAKGKYIGICGQGPSDHPDFAAWLMEQGIESVSLNPDSVLDTWFFLAEGNA